MYVFWPAIFCVVFVSVSVIACGQALTRLGFNGVSGICATSRSRHQSVVSFRLGGSTGSPAMLRTVWSWPLEQTPSLCHATGFCGPIDEDIWYQRHVSLVCWLEHGIEDAKCRNLGRRQTRNHAEATNKLKCLLGK